MMRTPLAKDLHELTPEEYGELFPVIITDYQDTWPELFRAEKNLIKHALNPSDLIQIDHIGSTAIPGIKAKPVIDILLQISEQANLENLKDIFHSLRYMMNEHPENPPPHLSFVKGYTLQGFRGQAYHVHIRFKGDWDEIRFRDYLINNKSVALEYEALKLKLARKHKNNREAYTGSKTSWITNINKLSQK